MMSKITNKKINEGDNQLRNESTKLQKNEERQLPRWEQTDKQTNKSRRKMKDKTDE